MKTKLFVSLLFIVIVAPAFAGKPHRGGGKPEGQQQTQSQPPPPLPAPASQLASARLSQFTAAHLDRILAPLDQQVVLPRTELSQLRASLLDQWTKSPEPEKAQYQAAIAVCDAISSAMDEREKALANVQSSSNAPVSQDVHDVRESLPRHGRGSGKAARAGRHQQQDENKENENKAAQKSAFLSSVHYKEWTDRAAVLRQRIQQFQSQQLAAEQAAQQLKTAPQPNASVTPR